MLPGSIPPSHVQLWLGVTVTVGSTARVMNAWAQNGRKTWAGASRAPPGPKGVMVGRRLSPGLLRSPRWE